MRAAKSLDGRLQLPDQVKVDDMALGKAGASERFPSF